MIKGVAVYVAVGITIVLLGSACVSANSNLYTFNKIINLSYNHEIYLTYENGTPTFYIDTPKDFKLKKVYVYADGGIADIVRSLGFKLRNSIRDCDIVVSTHDVQTKKTAIIFLKGEKGVVKNVIWITDPLKLKKTSVIAYCNVLNRGKVIAKYADGGNAVVKVGNKIYVGFKPSRATLANIITSQILEKVVRNPVEIVVLTFAFTATIIYAFREALLKLISKLVGVLGTIVAVGYINLRNKEAVLLNNLRREIYNYVLENPGVHLREICRTFDISMSTATWHLKILEKAGFIKSERFKNKIVYYPAGMVKEELVLMLTLNDDKAKSIVRYLLDVGKAHLRKIARDLNLNVETARYHVKKLERAGVIQSSEEKNRIVYSVNEETLKVFKHILVP